MASTKLENKVDVTFKRTEKKIGVELEFFNTTREKVAEAVSRKGIKIKIEGWRGTKVFAGDWKITTDASVTGIGTGLGKGLEIVSPPLKAEEMKRQLKLVTEALAEVGAKVDRTCGVHVHHEIDDLKLDQIKNIYRIYKKHNDTIDSFFPKSRRANSPYNHYTKGLTDEDMQRVEHATGIYDLSRIDRYRTINFKSYIKYGTIEFRQHSGSVDFEKIFNWVLITQNLVHSASTKKTIRKRGEKVNHTMAFNKEIGTYRTNQGAYFRDRRAYFRKQEEQVAN